MSPEQLPVAPSAPAKGGGRSPARERDIAEILDVVGPRDGVPAAARLAWDFGYRAALREQMERNRSELAELAAADLIPGEAS